MAVGGVGGGGERESLGGEGGGGARHGTEAMERVPHTPISQTVALHSEGPVIRPYVVVSHRMLKVLSTTRGHSIGSGRRDRQTDRDKYRHTERHTRLAVPTQRDRPRQRHIERDRQRQRYTPT